MYWYLYPDTKTRNNSPIQRILWYETKGLLLLIVSLRMPNPIAIRWCWHSMAWRIESKSQRPPPITSSDSADRNANGSDGDCPRKTVGKQRNLKNDWQQNARLDQKDLRPGGRDTRGTTYPSSVTLQKRYDKNQWFWHIPIQLVMVYRKNKEFSSVPADGWNVLL